VFRGVEIVVKRYWRYRGKVRSAAIVSRSRAIHCRKPQQPIYNAARRHKACATPIWHRVAHINCLRRGVEVVVVWLWLSRRGRGTADILSVLSLKSKEGFERSVIAPCHTVWGPISSRLEFPDGGWPSER
jgi:hypothetical protein